MRQAGGIRRVLSDDDPLRNELKAATGSTRNIPFAVHDLDDQSPASPGASATGPMSSPDDRNRQCHDDYARPLWSTSSTTLAATGRWPLATIHDRPAHGCQRLSGSTRRPSVSAGGLESPPVVAHLGVQVEVAADSSDQSRDVEDVDEQMVRPIRVVDNPFVRSSRALDYSTLRYG